MIQPIRDGNNPMTRCYCFFIFFLLLIGRVLTRIWFSSFLFFFCVFHWTVCVIEPFVIYNYLSSYWSVFLASMSWISDARCPPICVVVAGSAGERHLFYVFVAVEYTARLWIVPWYYCISFVFLLVFVWYLMYFIFICSFSSTDSTFQFNLWMTDVCMNRHLSPCLLVIGCSTHAWM
jgi:hypothetical protein